MYLHIRKGGLHDADHLFWCFERRIFRENYIPGRCKFLIPYFSFSFFFKARYPFFQLSFCKYYITFFCYFATPPNRIWKVANHDLFKAFHAFGIVSRNTLSTNLRQVNASLASDCLLMNAISHADMRQNTVQFKSFHDFLCHKIGLQKEWNCVTVSYSKLYQRCLKLAYLQAGELLIGNTRAVKEHL